MFNLDRNLIEIVKKENLSDQLLKGNFGLEKENVRVDKNGDLATTTHPLVFAEKSENPYITTDFSESQVEMITPPLDSLEKAYNFLNTLQNVISLNLEDELLWPQSVPPKLPDEEHIPLAIFKEKGLNLVNEDNLYRERLAEKYGKKKQMISGIHYNFSFSDNLLKGLRNKISPEKSQKDFNNDIYMKIVRIISKHSWFITRLIGNSPVTDKSFSDDCKMCSEITSREGSLCSMTSSVRNSECGYKNIKDYDVSLKTIDSYIGDLNELIKSGDLINFKEYYSTVRPKNSKGGLETLLKEGIEYVEIRMIDINPLFKNGISLSDLYLIHLFVLYALFAKEENIEDNIYKNSSANNRLVAQIGRKKDFEINVNGKSESVNNLSRDLFMSMKGIISLIDHKDSYLTETLGVFEQMVEDHNKLYSNILYEKLKKDGYMAFHLEKAAEYLEQSKREQFNFTGYEDMELSTQILMLDAVKRGVSIKVLDRFENFISLSKFGNTEYVKQATKTSLDSYSTVLLMENKVITKDILQKSNFNVPYGDVYTSKENALRDFHYFENQAIVVKPNTTNFGIGISIFKDGFTRLDFEQAVNLAFENDQTVLIEKFVEGKEYRIFVIGDQVVGVLHRVPANVLGDGQCSIRQLVTDKNKNPIRGSSYRKPLEKIKLGEEEALFLSQQNLDFDSVIAKGEIVYLRENSNISTGGDSIDFTDKISNALKNIAVKAAKAIGATIVGLDLMTKDISGETLDDYNIIELNFNPAIHIHCFPLVGKNRHLGDRILDILGFK